MEQDNPRSTPVVYILMAQSPDKLTADIPGNLFMVCELTAGGLERVIVGLVIIGPVSFGESRLNFCALARIKRSSRTRKAYFQIIIGSGNRIRQFHEIAGYICTPDTGPVAPEVLCFFPINCIVITEFYITKLKRRIPGVDYFEFGRNSVGRGACAAVKGLIAKPPAGMGTPLSTTFTVRTAFFLR